MYLEAKRSSEEFYQLASEWNYLLPESASHVPFLRHEYLTTWWQTRGGGEWPNAELFVVTARDENHRLVGIAPLFFSRNPDGTPALLLLGSIEISDYLDLIARPADLPVFLDRLFDFLSGEHAPPWEALDFYNIPDNSPTLPLMRSRAEQHHWSYIQQALLPSPYIPLPGDWETYLARLDKKQRHEIRRKMRRAESYEKPVRWYIVQDETSLDSEIDGFLMLMQQDEEKARFLTDAMRSQIRQSVHTAFQAGWLQLAFLEIDGEKAAGYLNFDYANQIWVYNSGLNENYRELSPGWVLLSYLLQWSNENHRAEFDFMRGGEDYKYRFGGVNRFVVRATAKRKSLRG